MRRSDSVGVFGNIISGFLISRRDILTYNEIIFWILNLYYSHALHFTLVNYDRCVCPSVIPRMTSSYQHKLDGVTLLVHSTDIGPQLQDAVRTKYVCYIHACNVHNTKFIFT